MLLVLVVCASGLVIQRIAFDEKPMNAWAYFSLTIWGFLAVNAAYRLITGRSGNGAARS
jgi:multisubunit Na+/H+ antiporter MnhB subunit